MSLLLSIVSCLKWLAYKKKNLEVIKNLLLYTYCCIQISIKKIPGPRMYAYTQLMFICYIILEYFYVPLFRFITILYYLNDVEEGGETAFPVADQPDYDHEVRILLLDIYTLIPIGKKMLKMKIL